MDFLLYVLYANVLFVSGLNMITETDFFAIFNFYANIIYYTFIPEYVCWLLLRVYYKDLLTVTNVLSVDTKCPYPEKKRTFDK